MPTTSTQSDTIQPHNDNVDEQEIAKFEALAQRWWDTNSEFKPLHEINPLRANFIDERSLVAEQKVLDVGCCGGILTEASHTAALMSWVSIWEKHRSVLHNSTLKRII